MILSTEWDPVATFQRTLRQSFSGNLSKSPKRLQEFLKILSKETENYGGSAALKAFEDELQRQGLPVTLNNLDHVLFSSERNAPLLDHYNPNDEAANPRLGCTLKVKVYMGEGWKLDFKDLDLLTPPDLYVKVGIVSGDEPMKRTETKTNNWKPTWGEEFSFNLVDPEALLSIKVYDYDFGTRDDFAGETTLPVSLLSQGIRSVPLLFEDGKKCSKTWLLMRFVFV